MHGVSHAWRLSCMASLHAWRLYRHGVRLHGRAPLSQKPGNHFPMAIVGNLIVSRIGNTAHILKSRPKGAGQVCSDFYGKWDIVKPQRI